MNYSFKHKVGFLILIAALTMQVKAYSQTFLNGSFEINTAPAGVDQINLTNATFNSLMSNTIGFGSTENLDIITSATWGGSGAQHGLWYISFTGGGTDCVTMELSATLIAGNSYSISFYDRTDAAYVAFPFTIGVSATNNSLGTAVYTGTTPIANTWTQHTFSFVAPITGQYISVVQGGPISTSNWAHIDNFSFTSIPPTDTIITGTVIGSPFCACDSIIVPFTSVGSFVAGNVYTAQLSDAAGSFAAPVSIGTLLSTANSGNIHCMIPCATPPGNGYRVRVVSTTPSLIGNDNGINIIVNSTVTPLVTISASPSGAVCSGDLVTFTATETGGGTTPTYQWLVNGANAGTNSSVFSSSAFVNGDFVTCILYSSSTCASPDSAISNAIVLVVNSVVTPQVNISASPSGAICVGDLVTFTAAETGGGSTPTYQWLVNGVNAGTNSSTFSSNTFVNGDVVSVILYSSSTCASPDSAVSTEITLLVNTIPTPQIIGDTLVCAGATVMLTASGGSTYIWSTGATTATITVNPLVNSTYTVTAYNGTCGETASITIEITTSATIHAWPDTTIEAGESVQLHSSGGTSWSWFPPGSLSCPTCQNPYATPSTTTSYIVTSIDAGGCIAQDTVTVTVELICGEVFIPSAFSPNNDGFNDILYVRNNCIEVLEFAIYDRWGNKVFFTDNPEIGWDGKLRGKDMDGGVFVFYLNAMLKDKTTIIRQGNITLIR